MTLSKEAFFLEDRQPMICYDLRWFWLPCCRSGVKRFEVSMSSLEGVVPVSNPRRLHCTWCTQLLSAAKVSYLFGRRSSTYAPVGRAASSWSVLFSSPLVAHSFGGDGHRLWSSGLRFQHWAGSLLGVEAA